jgi:Na+/H+ antiporter NhaD/arsenite permease-like protein
MTLAIIIAFVLGYLLITLEGNLKVNKTAIALLMSAVLWTLYTFNADAYLAPGASFDSMFLSHVGDTSEIIFFLLGAMTIVEVVDINGGFNFVRNKLASKSKRSLLWKITLITFFLSAILDNLTTSIVMIMVLRKLVRRKRLRILYAAMIIIAANAGGAFSPIGDVTTIMLWIKGNVSTLGPIEELLLPSLATVVVPGLVLHFKLKGQLEPAADNSEETPVAAYDFSLTQRNVVFYVGVLGLVLVPVFRTITGLPPFMGVILVLSILWVITECFYNNRKIESNREQRVSRILKNIDMSTILFFLGILMAVAALQETGTLSRFGAALDQWTGGNHYLVTGLIGVASSVVDNVPLVASCMGMYPIAPTGDFATDGIFWQLLAYCAGTGGSILIIGSAAGVVVMGLEKISFGWYLRHFSLWAFLGMLSGMLVYFCQRLLFF